MGKRELMLIVAFVILGGIVYQATAPPPAPGEQGFSISRMVDSLRREVRGNRASAQHQSTAVQAIDATVTEVRVALGRGPLTIEGEARLDVSAELVATSNGFDDAEARKLVRETVVKFDRAGTILFVSVDYPEPGSQSVRSLALKVPDRLLVRMIEGNVGGLTVSNVAAVELGAARGKTTLRQIAGRITASHRGGDLVITDAGSLKLSARGSDVTLTGIRGEASINTQAGDLKTTGIVGPIELEANSTDVRLEALERTTGRVTVNAAGGSIEMRGLRSDSRIDVRNADLQLVVGQPATIGVYSEDGEAVQITLPAGGFSLDAIARRGGIRTTPDDLAVRWGLAVTGTNPDAETKMSGSVKGGGPLLTVRTNGLTTLAAPGDATTTPPAAAKS